MKIKFMWNGIKVDGRLYRCFYSDGKLLNHPEGTLTIYRKDYEPMPTIVGLLIQNDTDTMTDYFEKDRIRIMPDNLYYDDVKNAISLAKKHYENRRQ